MTSAFCGDVNSRAAISYLVPTSITENSPSMQDDIDPKVEQKHRMLGCELVQHAGFLLKCPQVVMVTGQNILHRFYYRKSLKRYDILTIAMGSLLLATKVEEQSKILRDILFVFYRIYQRRRGYPIEGLELGGLEYNCWKDQLRFAEAIILKELGFALYNVMENPHKYILFYIRMFKGNNDFAQSAWNYCNDIMRLDVCIKVSPAVLAAVAVFKAALHLGISLPVSESTRPWWTVLGTTLEEMISLSRLMDNALYAVQNEVDGGQWLDPLCPGTEYLDITSQRFVRFKSGDCGTGANVGEILSVPSSDVNVYTGVDAAPTAILNGSDSTPIANSLPTDTPPASHSPCTNNTADDGTRNTAVGTARDREGYVEIDRYRDRDRDRERNRSTDRDREGYVERNRYRDRDRDRDRERNRSTDRDREGYVEIDRYRDRDRDRDRERNRSTDRDREGYVERNRYRERD